MKTIKYVVYKEGKHYVSQKGSHKKYRKGSNTAKNAVFLR